MLLKDSQVCKLLWYHGQTSKVNSYTANYITTSCSFLSKRGQSKCKTYWIPGKGATWLLVKRISEPPLIAIVRYQIFFNHVRLPKFIQLVWGESSLPPYLGAQRRWVTVCAHFSVLASTFKSHPSLLFLNWSLNVSRVQGIWGHNFNNWGGVVSVWRWKHHDFPNSIRSSQFSLLDEWPGRGSLAWRHASPVWASRLANCILHASGSSHSTWNGDRCFRDVWCGSSTRTDFAKLLESLSQRMEMSNKDGNNDSAIGIFFSTERNRHFWGHG